MERLHEKVQSRLGEHFMARYEDSGRLGHLEALVAHTMADADLLLSKPVTNHHYHHHRPCINHHQYHCRHRPHINHHLYHQSHTPQKVTVIQS